ncbi:hypothetical protein [Cupriavidus necator]|uniref:hypothetical protein n=1 Tax=Cupriavidus necator TaxID=106590 RepID=UPI000AB861A1|nr:hypothetical protein [Cupriavidus necator]
MSNPEPTLAVTRLFSRKDALNESRLEAAHEPASAAPGEVLLRLDRFALTTNNIPTPPSARPCSTGSSSALPNLSKPTHR